MPAVVTAFHMKTHPLPAAFACFTMNWAQEVLAQGLYAFESTRNDNVRLFARFQVSTGTNSFMIVFVLHADESQSKEDLMREAESIRDFYLEQVGTRYYRPKTSRITLSSWIETLLLHGTEQKGPDAPTRADLENCGVDKLTQFLGSSFSAGNYARSLTFGQTQETGKDWVPATVQMTAMMKAAVNRTRGAAYIQIDFVGGAVEKMRPDETPYPWRTSKSRLTLQVHHSIDPSTAEEHKTNSLDMMSLLQEVTGVQDAYVNYLDLEPPQVPHQVSLEHRYFGRNAERMASIIAEYDPSRMFNSCNAMFPSLCPMSS
mmetsp:Transcript_56478/g.157420  ORF Transcript_56478/g.157420 Transcript_56478/m.157420 type:complete len:316 (+) Transcript_56478:915-1862(+)